MGGQRQVAPEGAKRPSGGWGGWCGVCVGGWVGGVGGVGGGGGGLTPIPHQPRPLPPPGHLLGGGAEGGGPAGTEPVGEGAAGMEPAGGQPDTAASAAAEWRLRCPLRVLVKGRAVISLLEAAASSEPVAT